jgi:hypothetical protein
MSTDVDDSVINDAAQVVPNGREHRWQDETQLLHPACDHARSLSAGEDLPTNGRDLEATPESLDATFRTMSVYVDHAFAVGDWGRWSGGGHLQADTLDELHAFAARIGMRREWFQTKPGRPENDHYDLTRALRERAISLGAMPEDRRAGTRRRQAIREARRASR